MRIVFLKSADKEYRSLSPLLQKLVKKQLSLLADNLHHPSVRAKKYDESRGIWQGRAIETTGSILSPKGTRTTSSVSRNTPSNGLFSLSQIKDMPPSIFSLPRVSVKYINSHPQIITHFLSDYALLETTTRTPTIV